MYFDPGTGSLLIQALIAAIAVAGGYFAIVKLKVKNLFKKNKQQADTEQNAGEETDEPDDEL